MPARLCFRVTRRFLQLAAVILPLLSATAAEVKPLKALLITGGCCHDYGAQKDILKKGLEERAHIMVEQIHTEDRSTKASFEIYKNPDWAKGYDIVIHDECSADVKDQVYVQNILNAHKTVPAVNLHCAMHSYRTGTDDWFKFVGIQSSSHGPQEPIALSFGTNDHPITKGMQKWTTIREELYNNVKVFETATPLVRGSQKVKRRDGTERVDEAVVAWVTDFNGTRVFSTTLGHNNQTVSDPRYLDLVARGTLWAAGKLDETHLKKTAATEKAEADAKHMADVKAPEGFDATIFAGPPLANYPVFVAAAPDGTVYVSSDGNGSLGRDPHRGRILRLRDIDGDGKADESKVFVNDVDSPRGLVWDNDRLYLLHPPHISAFIDHNGDGESDEQKILVKNIAFTFKDRPADHSSNGLELGIDGWLYCAIGDFGFMEAEGTDGRKLQLRAGGVVRVRPDGTGLELYSRGTRNILETATSPELDLISRDNTNDGGGWDIRLHHHTALAEHGYPSLYKNFGDEIVKPLADYGGGSGCGAAWIDEPGIPAEWNNAPFTADWGRNWIYQHRLTPKGSTFAAEQKEFLGITRATDLDVDANSRIYAASWKGATFNWAGPDVGYIVRLSPRGWAPAPLPEFNTLAATQLVEQLKSPSARRRVEAQRALVRKGVDEATAQLLVELAKNSSVARSSRVAAIFTLKQALGAKSHPLIAGLASDSTIQEFAIRALADRLEENKQIPADVVLSGLRAEDPRTRLQAAIALARMGEAKHAGALAALLNDSDEVVVHTTIQALKQLKAKDACLSLVDSTGASEAERNGALRVLSALHDRAVTTALLERLETERAPGRKRGLITALARLHFKEGVWKGDSWGTRPDTTGPYYQPETWSESLAILAALKKALTAAPASEATFIVSEFNRHKISATDAMDKIIDLAAADPSVLPALAGQLSRADHVPGKALPLLLQATSAEQTPDVTRAHAVIALSKVDKAEAVEGSLQALRALEQGKDAGAERERRMARDSFLNSAALENQRQVLLDLAAKREERSVLADAALLRLSDRKSASVEAKEAARIALEEGWKDPARREQILKAVRLLEFRPYRDKVVSALADSDPKVANAAREAARALRIEGDNNANESAKLESMAVVDVIRRATRIKGDPKLGESLFTQLTCNNCHTVSAEEAQRGPYLGNIAATYKRAELAEAILVPNKTLAQGFVANRFVLKDGEEHEGFVTLEAADAVTIRNVAAQEIKIPVSNINQREKLEKSLMPEGLAATLTLREFASLLDYLEALNAKK
ncbi:MAG TPA: PVC-type heme-binding CxxCH protein [Methylomirabilota bacterium]|nr:PVC-type heme-binding CxxCH protein [Methylomirabilota bacterium]